ncbi:putative low-complexity protein [Xenococcus sp. PCC 7305]|uniref:pentapeptide repeat-containing protein n=1 Tax=Xenococcus sp. PCC 7305 TaxID=102125 RepID=UPI0002AC6D5B|nr:pentapeptide repeat-containing protein [Xenococcus sp. PCC 7305]ELS04346.1 putative low-complexity protein [Xenococcus sp. PCC 7305]
MPNVTPQEALNKITKLVEKNTKQKHWLTWFFETAGVPIGATILAAVASWTTFTNQADIDKNNIERTVVENYLLQMEDILLNLEGVEGLIKWGKETEKEASNFNKKIKDELDNLVSIRQKLEVKPSNQQLENRIVMSLSNFLYEDDIKGMKKSLEKVEETKLEDVENKLHDLEIGLERILEKFLNKIFYFQKLDKILKVFQEELEIEATIDDEKVELGKLLDELIEEIPKRINSKQGFEQKKIEELTQKILSSEKLENILVIIEAEAIKGYGNDLDLKRYKKIAKIVKDISATIYSAKEIEKNKNRKVDRYLLVEAKTLVQTKTSNALYILSDEFRRQTIIEFLRDSNLGFLKRETQQRKRKTPLSFDTSNKLLCEAIEDDKDSSKVNNNYEFDRSSFLHDLAVTRIQNIDLSGNDLSFIQLQRGKLNGANLKRAELSSSNFSNAFLIGANLTEAYLLVANLENANLKNANLNRVNLRSSILKGANLEGAEMNKANLGGRKLTRSQDSKFYKKNNLSKIDLEKVINNLEKVKKEDNLINIDLEKIEQNLEKIINNLEKVKKEDNLINIDLGKVKQNLGKVKQSLTNTIQDLEVAIQNLEATIQDLEVAIQDLEIAIQDLEAAIREENLSNVNLECAKLNLASLKKSDFTGSNFKGANLEGANLEGANLSKADLKGANLKSASINQANFSGSNLEGANLSVNNFKTVNLSNANLDGAYLAWVFNLTNKKIKSTCDWDKAIYTNADWDKDKEKWFAKDKEANEKKIGEIMLDKASDPKIPINCEKWNYLRDSNN